MFDVFRYRTTLSRPSSSRLGDSTQEDGVVCRHHIRRKFRSCRRMPGSTIFLKTIHLFLWFENIFAFFLQKSGLSVALGSMFDNFQNFQPWVLALVLSAITSAVTQITSNTATSTIFLPIVAQLVSTAALWLWHDHLTLHKHVTCLFRRKVWGFILSIWWCPLPSQLHLRSCCQSPHLPTLSYSLTETPES